MGFLRINTEKKRRRKIPCIESIVMLVKQPRFVRKIERMIITGESTYE